jgi:hypothetical protein
MKDVSKRSNIDDDEDSGFSVETNNISSSNITTTTTSGDNLKVNNMEESYEDGYDVQYEDEMIEHFQSIKVEGNATPPFKIQYQPTKYNLFNYKINGNLKSPQEQKVILTKSITPPTLFQQQQQQQQQQPQLPPSHQFFQAIEPIDNGQYFMDHNSVNENDGVIFINEKCKDTINGERRFIERYNLEKYTYDSNLNATVIYSRITKTHYVWPMERPLTAKILYNNFKGIGHTLAIDYSFTYRRMFSLDLDCICRRDPYTRQHLNEQTVMGLCESIKRLFVHLTNVAVNVMIWQSQERSNCGFHIYSDCEVSLPTHLHLAHLIRAEINKNAMGDTVIIEVPTFMPLPLSAKTPRKEYISLLPQYNDNENIFLTTHNNTTIIKSKEKKQFNKVYGNGYIELFRYSTNTDNVQKAISMKKRRNNNNNNNDDDDGDDENEETSPTVLKMGIIEQYNNHKIHIILKQLLNNKKNHIDEIRAIDVPRFQCIHKIDITDIHMQQLSLYITNLVEIYNKSKPQHLAISINIDNSDVELKKVIDRLESAGGASLNFNNFTGDDGDVDIACEVSVIETINNFLILYNSRMTMIQEGQPIDDPTHFIKTTSEDYGCMYMQPLLVAFYKYVSSKIHIITNADFRVLLKHYIYKSVIDSRVVLRTFVERFEKNTIEAYYFDYNTILEHVRYMIIHDLSPFKSLNDNIDKLMTIRNNGMTAKMLQDELAKKKKDEQNAILINLLDTFFNILKELRVILYDETATRYYVNVDYFYKSIAKGKITTNELPSCLFNWIGQNMTSAIHLHLQNILNYSLRKYYHPYTQKVTPKFMISTSGGVYNSATNTYTAHTPLLVFVKFRFYWVWNWYEGTHYDNSSERAPVMYEKQNEDIQRLTSKALLIVKDMESIVTDLYLHFMVVPAILQLRYILSVDEFSIYKFVNIMAKHRSFSSIYTLIDYFPVDPKFVYLISYFHKKYENLNIMLNYTKLRDRIFNYDNVDGDDWLRRFGIIYRHIKYNPDEKLNQLERITSIIVKTHNDENNTSATTASTNHYDEEIIFANNNHDYNEQRNGDDYKLDKFNDNEMFLYNLIAVCMIKCESFETLTSAFRVNELPKEPLKIHADYEEFNERKDVSLENCIYAKERAYKKVFGGSKMDLFRKSLIERLFSIGISANFEPEKCTSILDILTPLNISFNACKKINMLFGVGDVGKSYLCDDAQAMCEPKVSRINDLSKMHDRFQGASATSNLMIINEANSFNASTIKSITGNDAESSMRMYTQNFEMHHDQCTILAATNSYITFTTEVERTAINRIYAVTLTGTSCPESVKIDSLFGMMTDAMYFRELVNLGSSSPRTLVWLVYCRYLLMRDKNLCPTLNSDSEDCRKFQLMVYYNNNKTFRTLVNCGLIEEKGFYINAKKLLSIVRKSFEKSERDKQYDEFKRKFQQLYNINFNTDEYVNNFQQSGLIQHVYTTMDARYEECAEITHKDIIDRLSIYNVSEDRNNAKKYFDRTYGKYYDYNKKVYRNLSFTHDEASDYFDPDNTSSNRTVSNYENDDDYNDSHVMNFV